MGFEAGEPPYRDYMGALKSGDIERIHAVFERLRGEAARRELRFGELKILTQCRAVLCTCLGLPETASDEELAFQLTRQGRA